eukprot:PhM_4_TR6402/c0_g1_i1/m.98592
MSDIPENANEGCVGPQSEQAGKASGCAGCPNQALCASAPKGPDPYAEVIKRRMANVKHKVLVLSGKGGVGKSTLTKELGFALGRLGLTVGLVDTDICGPSLPRMTGCETEEVHNSNDGWEPVAVDDNVVVVSTQLLLQNRDEAIVWRGPRKNKMIKDFLGEVSWGGLDILLFDTPPGTTDEHISTVSLLQSGGGVDGAIVVTTPQEVAVADVRRELTFCAKTKLDVLGVVENMSPFVCPKCHKTSDVFPSRAGQGTAGERLAAEYGVRFLGRVPLDPNVMRSCDAGVPLIEHTATSPAARAIDDLAALLLKLLRVNESVPVGGN